MAGGSTSHPKSSAHNNPSSSHSDRKSRWDPPPSTITTPNNTKLPSDPKPSNPASDKNPSPRTKPGVSPRPNNSSTAPPCGPAFPFPDLDPPPPLPTYGFHMLQRRTIYLVDGSARTYLALPPDYQDFPTRLPLPPHVTRFHIPEKLGLGFPNQNQKRKYGEEDLNYANGNNNSNPNGMVYTVGSNRGVVGTSSPFGRDSEEVRAGKYMRLGGGGGSSDAASAGAIGKHVVEVDENQVKKAFFNFVKVVNENEAERKRYLEDGKQGRLRCAACGRKI